MTNSALPACKIGDRIECNGSYGTVKYIGSIEGKPSIWLGIDWDNPERGKHNGIVNGVQYFETRSSTSGSFIRPEKAKFGKSALASIESRYGHIEDEFTARLNQQKHLLIQQTMKAPFLEMVGFDKIFNKQSNFSSLKIVNLRDQNVSFAGSSIKLGETCPNIEELDISKNLFISWQDVIEICNQLPKLFWLNVSENILSFPDNFGEIQYENVKTVICGSMGLSWSDVCRIGVVFPQVEEFRAPNNRIENLDTTEEIFSNLKLLDLEGNRLKHWSEICKLGHLSSLEQLNVENVGLTEIIFDGEEPKVGIFQNLRKLCVVKNLLNEWDSVAELNRLENLEQLKISKNPIIDSENPKTIAQVLVAKIGSLKVLNGVEIEASERRGAEYDYIKKYGLEWLKVKNGPERSRFLKTHNRYLELLEKYGEPEESELIDKPKILKSALITLKLVYQDRVIEKKMPPTITVQKLIILAQKLFNLSEKPQLLYKSSSDEFIEIFLDDEMKEIGFYSIECDDKIIIL